MHIYDGFPESSFILAGALDKTTHLVFHVSSMYQDRDRDLVIRIGELIDKHADFQQELEELGYFTFFIRLFCNFAG